MIGACLSESWRWMTEHHWNHQNEALGYRPLQVNNICCANHCSSYLNGRQTQNYPLWHHHHNHHHHYHQIIFMFIFITSSSHYHHHHNHHYDDGNVQYFRIIICFGSFIIWLLGFPERLGSGTRPHISTSWIKRCLERTSGKLTWKYLMFTAS